MIVAGAADELEDDVAIAISGAHADHHRIPVAASVLSVPPSAPANLTSSATPQASRFATALQISTPNAALSSG